MKDVVQFVLIMTISMDMYLVDIHVHYRQVPEWINSINFVVDLLIINIVVMPSSYLYKISLYIFIDWFFNREFSQNQRGAFGDNSYIGDQRFPKRSNYSSSTKRILAVILPIAGFIVISGIIILVFLYYKKFRKEQNRTGKPAGAIRLEDTYSGKSTKEIYWKSDSFSFQLFLKNHPLKTRILFKMNYNKYSSILLFFSSINYGHFIWVFVS